MRWLSNYFARRRADRSARRAAKAFFRKTHPRSWVHAVRIVDREGDDVFVAIWYFGLYIPPPLELYRVTRDGTVSETDGENWPRGLGDYY